MMLKKRRYRVFLSYDGTGYRGWQRQPEGFPTIQQELETVLSRLLSQRVVIVASGRTDAGVHARIQVAHMDCDERSVPFLESGRFVYACNQLLDRRVRLLKVEPAEPGFHAIREVKKKTYIYFIDTASIQMPPLAPYSWHLRLPLDWKAMEAATALVPGTHDFTAFSDTDTDVKSKVRTVYEAYWGTAPTEPWDWPQSDHLRAFRITGEGFLKHMVRSLVGSLVQVGSGRMSVDQFQHLLVAKSRRGVGPTAPPHGLWLWDILYLTSVDKAENVRPALK